MTKPLLVCAALIAMTGACAKSSPKEDADGDQSAGGMGGADPDLGDTTSSTGGSGGAPAVSCGNGQLDDGEACDGEDVGDVSCQSLGYATGAVSCTASCSVDTTQCGFTEDCLSSIDEDKDGALSCADSDCAGSAACVPGATPIGEACTAHTDCAATGGMPQCFTGAQYPGGYCTEHCTGSGSCPIGNVCLGYGDNGNDGVLGTFCFDYCETTEDCRGGYNCHIELKVCTTG